MSYCLSINTYEGLVLCASSFVATDLKEVVANSHMQHFIWPGNRFIVVLSSGNQLTIDGVFNKVQQDLNNQAPINLLSVNSLDEASDYLAGISVSCQHALIANQVSCQSVEANFIVAGQIYGQTMQTLLISAEGSYIHESNDSPFLQIGEMKFGKPILDRMVKQALNLNTAARCALVSVDSTVFNNQSLTMKTELMIYKNNSLTIGHYLLLDDKSEFFSNMSSTWSEGITLAIEGLPQFDWEY